MYCFNLIFVTSCYIGTLDSFLPDQVCSNFFVLVSSTVFIRLALPVGVVSVLSYPFKALIECMALPLPYTW